MTSATSPLCGPLRKRESHMWEREKNDHYVEPAFCSERLFAIERFDGPVWDPACGFGNIVKSAWAAGLAARGSDLIDRGFGLTGHDFLDPIPWIERWQGDIVTNPPFNIAEAFVKRALALATGKVAMLLPAKWVQGDKRSRWLEETPLARVLFITPRPSMPPGHVIGAGGKPGNGTTDYAWFVWRHGHNGAREIGWCRRDA